MKPIILLNVVIFFAMTLIFGMCFAYMERGYFAIGGELPLSILAVVLYLKTKE